MTAIDHKLLQRERTNVGYPADFINRVLIAMPFNHDLRTMLERGSYHVREALAEEVHELSQEKREQHAHAGNHEFLRRHDAKQAELRALIDECDEHIRRALG